MFRNCFLVTLTLVAWLNLNPAANAILVVGDEAGGSIYTTPPGDGQGWDYVGHLIGTAPSSVSYVASGWFLTAQHVWDNDITRATNPEESLLLGGNTYGIDTDSYISITNPSGSSADLCMFRVTDSAGLPAGRSVLESTPESTDALRLVGNGFDKNGNTGLTWGNGTPYSWNSSVSKYTINGTTCYKSRYSSSTEGNAYAQVYDSGGGVFVDGQLAGVMVAVSYNSTYITDFSTYGKQINSVAMISAIPEPLVASSVLLFGSTLLVVRRFRK